MPHVLAQDLRVAVLQYAIQGKLTTQEITDSNVDDFLNCIKEQKSRLIKEKAVKKQPKSVLFDEEELPFEIPDNWRWVSLIDLGFFSSGKTPNMAVPEYWDNGTVNWTTSKDLKTKYILSSKMKITELAASEMTLYPAGTLVMSVRSGILKHTLPVCILKKSSTINQDLKAYQLYDLRLSDYAFYVLKGLEPIILQDYTKRVTTVDSLRFDEFSQELPIPLPPIEEQARIVAKVDELMGKIDEYEKIEKELTELQKAFPGAMKDAILQAAMQGKLTEQLESDGDAFLLAQVIKEERSVLGKNKYVTTSEEDVDLPDTWAWIKSGECFGLEKGTKVSGVKLPYLEAKYLRGKASATYYDNGEMVLKGTKVILVDGENSGEVFTEPEDGIIGSTFKVLFIPKSINEKYALYFLDMNREKFRNNKKGAAIPHLSKELFNDLQLPIPPIEEQQRIVDKLDQLLPLCEQLEKMAA